MRWEWECGHPLAGFVKWAHDSRLARVPFFMASAPAFRDAHPDSHLDLRWNRCRLPQPETHQSPIRIKARPIGGVRQSLALGTAVPQKILSARPLSIATADKSCGSPRAMDPVGANPLLAQPRGDSVAPVTGGERGGAYG